MSAKRKTFSGINSLQALQLARGFGCVIYQPRRTGELVIAHHSLPRRVRMSAARKDAPRALTTLIGHLARQCA